MKYRIIRFVACLSCLVSLLLVACGCTRNDTRTITIERNQEGLGNAEVTYTKGDVTKTLEGSTFKLPRSASVELKIKMTAAEETYTWFGWYEGTVKVSSDKERVHYFTVDRDITLTAKWARNEDLMDFTVLEEGKEVTLVYYYNLTATSCVVPDGITAIGDRAFRITYPAADVQPAVFSTVTLPEGITSIGSQAFMSCASLSSVSLPSTLEEIDDEAFAHCTSLSDLTVPNSSRLQTIGSEAFADTPWLASASDGYVMIGTVVYTYKDHEEEPSVLVLPQDATAIAAGAFAQRTTLSSVVLPSGLVEIASGAFSWCTSLASLSLPEGTIEIAAGAFEKCTSLVTLTFPKSLRVIEKWAFCGCTGLEAITVKARTTTIGRQAFSGCTSLLSLSFPEGITSLGAEAFSGTGWLLAQEDGFVMIGDMLYDYIGTVPARLVFPESVVSIADKAFASCTELEDITLPAGLKAIGSAAFAGCTGLTRVVIPEGIPRIEEETFSGCSSLSSITLPKSLTEIGTKAFIGCTALTHVDLPKSLTSIGDKAFKLDNALVSISLPSSLTVVSKELFSGCTALASVVIASGIRQIDDGAFKDCTSLSTVVFPASLSLINGMAFSGCTALASATFMSATDWKETRLVHNVPTVTALDMSDAQENATRLVVPTYFREYMRKS